MPCNLFPPLLFQSVPFGDKDAFLDWNGSHMLWHRVMARMTKTPFRLIDDLRMQLEPHAAMHEAVDKFLGIAAPYDLVSYSLTDRESYYGFMATHGLEHDRQRKALGI